MKIKFLAAFFVTLSVSTTGLAKGKWTEEQTTKFFNNCQQKFWSKESAPNREKACHCFTDKASNRFTVEELKDKKTGSEFLNMMVACSPKK